MIATPKVTVPALPRRARKRTWKIPATLGVVVLGMAGDAPCKRRMSRIATKFAVRALTQAAAKELAPVSSARICGWRSTSAWERSRKESFDVQEERSERKKRKKERQEIAILAKSNGKAENSAFPLP